MTAREKFTTFLANFPTPGGGGAHTGIFRAGCLGARAGLTPEKVMEEVETHMPYGTRAVSQAEIEQGVEAGFAEVKGGRPKPRQEPSRLAPGTLARLIAEGKGTTEADIRARSPVPIDWPEHEGWRVLEALYGPEEWLFIGDDESPGILDRTIQPAAIWIASLRQQGLVPCPKFMPNPLTGLPGPKKCGTGTTLRGDSCIAAHRFVVAEFDTVPLDDQLAFWRAVPHLPVAALIHSGKKSIHAWLRVDCRDKGEWETQIENDLFPAFLKPLGLDPSCRNSSRLSRMPGHKREDTGAIQRCLYLAPEGKAVCQ